ncbi:dihydroorotate dehydrogenase (NAD+) catalytic subunit [Alkalithermobacter thermoalcaliphilus JW-YL-7 = DSM 7308]|uniref:Dihydroorotate dehydrogenase n=1 Tax=Alkalithermobacter thermoalcaliphilus JW-YL-7 = DSM 7308 TaxID=1121328 RepID=A0A150FPZ5_CLOPD|nr:Dihydroorotate dehydrogenase [[Clostridium] paradoxum JW-YL-7 = DSM 7308]SHK89910.1 dihydroorotate dehydrogenase (NAD+) catalytic subunit [[Clostridium] paradoxum JW-YL-7 = DSM 7308]
MTNLSVKFGKLNFKNPVVMASGTFGFGKEYERIYDIQKLGGICTKGITLNKRDGNSGIRVWETSSGMLNSVGLENPGMDKFIKEYNDYLKSLDLVSIVNIGGSTIDEYIESVEIACKNDVDAIELNISCPNVKQGGIAFGIKTDIARQVVRKARDICNVPLIVKLSPNAENIVDMALMCEEEGADGVSLVNTFMAMAINIDKRKAIFDNIYAGLSGPCIKPIALRMVHQVCKNVSIPVMGMGGITNYKDALEFIMVGATCIQVGTANFINPRIGIDIINGIKDYMEKENIKSLDEIRGII